MDNIQLAFNEVSMEELEFDEVLSAFTRNIESLNEVSPLINMTLKAFMSRGAEEFNNHLEEHGEAIDESEGYKVPVHHRGKVDRLSSMLNRIELASSLIPKTFLVSYVSEFDSFLGNLLKVIYRRRPELLNESERQLTFSELQAFDSIQDAREHILEKEVETLLRKSHAEHFTILEKKFGLPLKDGLDIWADYIELTERRNLFVHCDGVVSSQYLSVCKLHKADINAVTNGERLKVDAEYLNNAYNVIYELATKLTHVLWRKLFPENRKIADSSYNDLCFELIKHEKYDLASQLLEFAVNGFKKHYDETYKRMFVINLAQAYKYSKQTQKCEKLLKRFDWNASGYDLKLAVAVLKDDYELATSYMDKVVATGDMGEQEFIDWPLFKEFRKEKVFLDKFKALFEKDFPNSELEAKNAGDEKQDARLSTDAANDMKKELLEEAASEEKKEDSIPPTEITDDKDKLTLEEVSNVEGN